MVLDIIDRAKDFDGHYPEVADALRNVAQEAKANGVPDRVKEFPPADFSFESQLERIKSDHIVQLDGLHKLGVVEKERENDRYYILDGSGEKHYAPTSEEVTARIVEQREELEPKMHQGFTKFQITPLVGKETLIAALGHQLVVKYQDKALYRAGTDNAVSLNVNGPVWKSSVHGHEPRYYVEEFGRNNGGMSFEELFREHDGFLITLEEDRPDLSKKPETLAGRRQFGPNTSAVETRQKTGKGVYRNEVGMITHQWLAMAIRTLRESGHVLDDLWGKGNAAILSGEYWMKQNLVPVVYFYYNFGRVELDDVNLEVRYNNCVPRVSVIVRKKN